MWQGLLVGAGSALALAVLLVGSVSLLAPPPGQTVVDVSRSDTPEAPVMEVAEDPLPAVPESPAPVTVVDETSVAARATTTATATSSSEAVGNDVLALPSGSQFNLPPRDTEPVTPAVDAQPASVLAGTIRPGAEAPVSAPAPNTQSAAQPVANIQVAGVSAPAAGATPARPAEVVESAPQTFREVVFETTSDEASDAAVAEAPVEATAPEDPQAPPAEAATEVVTAPVGAAEVPVVVAEVPVVEEAPVEEAPVEETVAEAVVAEEVVPEQTATEEVAAADPLVAPETTVDVAEITIIDDPIVIERPAEEPEPEVQIVPRRIVLDSERAAAEESAAQAEADGAATDPRALVAHGADFANPEGKPLFSIVLIDDPAGGLDRETLLAFSFPVTFAIDPTAPDAAETMAFYRAAGREVLMLADGLPQGGAPQDQEVALAGAMAQMPEVVGILDRQRGGLASNRTALGGILAPLAERGLGFVAYGAGLNAGVSAAQREGIAADVVYRILDAEQERAPRITRYLDRATFEAAQNGSAIVVGRTTEATVTALYSWALGRRSNTVAVAPISHVLLPADAR